MEFFRYVGPRVSERSLVMALSNSGRVSPDHRVAPRSSRRGARHRSTGRPTSGLAEASGTVLSQYVETPDLPSARSRPRQLHGDIAGSLPVRSRVGRLRGSPSDREADRIMSELAAQATVIEASVDANVEETERYAKVIATEPVLYILGAGPSLASSYFGCAKFYEQPQFEAVPQQLEEWAHRAVLHGHRGHARIVHCPAWRQSRPRHLSCSRRRAFAVGLSG